MKEPSTTETSDSFEVIDRVLHLGERIVLVANPDEAYNSADIVSGATYANSKSWCLSVRYHDLGIGFTPAVYTDSRLSQHLTSRPTSEAGLK